MLALGRMMMNVKEFDEFVEMWDEEGQPLDVDWLEYAQDFRNQTQQLEAREASARAIMQKFVDKVDSGLARSTETYAEMKEWLDD